MDIQNAPCKLNYSHSGGGGGGGGGGGSEGAGGARGARHRETAVEVGSCSTVDSNPRQY